MIRARVFCACVMAIVAVSCAPTQGKQASPEQVPRLKRPEPGRVLRDSLPSGTRVRFFEPKKWNGSVLMETFGGAPSTDSVLLNYLSRGYAVVRLSERVAMWDLSEKLDDLESVRDDVSRLYGRSAPVYLFGHSAGGYRALAALERNPGNYRGGVALCPATPTSYANLDFILDILVAFDHFFPNVLTARGESLADVRMSDRTPDLVDSAFASAPERKREMSRAFGVRTEDIAHTVIFYTAVLADFQEGAVGNPFNIGNHEFTGFDDDSAFNRSVRRIAADTAPARRLRERLYALTGRLATPTIILNSGYDALMLPRGVVEYAALLARTGSSEKLVVNEVAKDGHCNFSANDVAEAIDRVINWAGSGVRPASGALVGKAFVYPFFEKRPPSVIDGNWLVVGPVVNGKRSVARDTIIVTFREGTVYIARNGNPQGAREGFEVVANGDPLHVDGYDIFGERWFQLFEIKGDTMRLTYLLPDERSYRERPKSFREAGQHINNYLRLPDFPTRAPSEIDGMWQRVETFNNGRRVTFPRRIVETFEAGVRSQFVEGNFNGWFEGYAVNPNARPREMEFHDLLGQVWRGIYEIAGDTLRIASFSDDRRSLTERPRGFSPGPGVNVNVFRRVSRQD